MTTNPSHSLALSNLSNQVYLLVAPRRLLREIIGVAAARLALKGAVRILDGGNLFDAHTVARMVRRVMKHAGPDEAPLQRIHIARAFTCYQVEARLARQEVSPAPVLILDLLATFSDENASLAHRSYLMEQILGHLERLANKAPVLVGVSPAAEPPLDLYLRWLEHLAVRVLRYELPQPPSQP